MNRVLIAGAGYVGGRLAALLGGEGRRVWALRRHPSRSPGDAGGTVQMGDAGGTVEAIAADVLAPATLGSLPAVDAVVYAVSPADRTDAAYRDAYVRGLGHLLDALDRPGAASPRVVLVSSTGVYGYADGREVDEDTPPEPPDAPAGRILEGEARVRERGEAGVVVRLGGIYGPGRTRVVRSVLGGDAGCPPAGSYGNRIHRDDAAAAIRHLLDLRDPRPLYLGVDRDPAPLREVYRWIAERGGVADPCRGGRAEPEPEDRRGTSKRCSSRRLVESGFAFRYPTYREGYGPIIDALTASG